MDASLEYFMIGFLSKTTINIKVHIREAQIVFANSKTKIINEIEPQQKRNTSVVEELKNKFFLNLNQYDIRDIMKRLSEKQIPLRDHRVDREDYTEVA